MNVPEHHEITGSQLIIPKSALTSAGNKTGTWRFVYPGFAYKTAPCAQACPAGEDIPTIEMLFASGRFKTAFETIMMENPFPSVCGRVCFHPCENACNRKEFDKEVSVHRLERFIGDIARQEGFTRTPAQTQGSDRKVAIIGSGPAGLSCAFFLAMLGYGCEVFEAKTEAGGLLRWGIPAYRLPAHVLEEEIARILDSGVVLHTDHPVGREELNRITETFDGVFISTGLSLPAVPDIPGIRLAKEGLVFLEETRGGIPADIQGTALVIGGGNTAVDVSRTLVRMGVSPQIVYRRQYGDMPGFSHEIEMAVEEGVKILECLAPVSLEALEDKLVLTVQEMTPCGRDEAGRTRMEPMEGRTGKLFADAVFTAVGARPGQKELLDFLKAPENASSRPVYTGHFTLYDKTIPMGIGGDLTNSTLSVADAIGSGKAFAIGLDAFFKGGRENMEKSLYLARVGDGPALSMEIYLGEERSRRKRYVVGPDEINLDYFGTSPQVQPVILEKEKRTNNFLETEKTYGGRDAVLEASRCFNCGICNECDTCRMFCPEMAVCISSSSGTRQINLDYCKGCGICVYECPRNAMALLEDTI